MPNLFFRVNQQGHAVIFDEYGWNVTKIDENVYPVGSDWSCRWEHPEGIVLTIEDAKKLGIKHEDLLA